jgi:hypothetical protein
VVFAQTETEKAPAREYLFSLTESDQRKFAVRFDRLCQGEKLRNPDHLRDLRKVKLQLVIDGQKQAPTKTIWEVKIDGHRILAFQDQRDWVLTNGSPKVKKKAFSGEIETAIRIMAEYLGR